MNVTTQPILQVAPLTFNVIQGSISTNSVNFQNIGMGSLNISGTSATPGNWFGVSSSGGTSVLVNIDGTQLKSGTYSGNLVLSSNAAE